MLSESSETPRLVPVMNGSACAGILIGLGPRGVEAFEQDKSRSAFSPTQLAPRPRSRNL